MKKYIVCCSMLIGMGCVKKDFNSNANQLVTRQDAPITLAGTGYIGSVLGYNNTVRAGGLPSPTAAGNIIYNLPLYKAVSTEADWWDNIVEEVAYSGIDFMAANDRGYSPNSPNVDHGDPRKLVNLVAAMNRRGLGDAFKIAVFDDCPSSWTANRNVDNGQGYDLDPKFDCADTANYKYIWDYNIKVAFTNVPDAKRFRIDGKPVIIFWGAQPNWLINYANGNLKKILQYIRSKCQATFGFTPYFVVDKSWINNDVTTNDPAVIDAVHNWFIMANPSTLYTFNNVKTGVAVPGFRVVQGTTNMFIDANHGQTFINGLNNTQGAGANLTIVEGFTDCAENAAVFRSKDTVYYDYPNQRINIIRRYTSNPYPAVLKVEAEGCDYFNDVTSGNSGNTFREGDIDIVKTSDVNGGWHVTGAQTNEWLEWKELPLLSNSKFQIRYSSTAAVTVRFSVDGVDLPVVSLPVSGFGSWLTVDAGTYTTSANSLHTVRLKIISGTVSINYFNRVSGL